MGTSHLGWLVHRQCHYSPNCCCYDAISSGLFSQSIPLQIFQGKKQKWVHFASQVSGTHNKHPECPYEALSQGLRWGIGTLIPDLLGIVVLIEPQWISLKFLLNLWLLNILYFICEVLKTVNSFCYKIPGSLELQSGMCLSSLDLC